MSRNKADFNISSLSSVCLLANIWTPLHTWTTRWCLLKEFSKSSWGVYCLTEVITDHDNGKSHNISHVFWELGAVSLVVLMKTPADMFPSVVVPQQKLLWTCEAMRKKCACVRIFTLLYCIKQRVNSRGHLCHHITLLVPFTSLSPCSCLPVVHNSPVGRYPQPDHDFFIIKGYASVKKVHRRIGLRYTIVHFWSHEESCMAADRCCTFYSKQNLMTGLLNVPVSEKCRTLLCMQMISLLLLFFLKKSAICYHSSGVVQQH